MNQIEVEIDINESYDDFILTNGEEMKFIQFIGESDEHRWAIYRDVIVSYKDKLWRFEWIESLKSESASKSDFYGYTSKFILTEVKPVEVTTIDYLPVE